MALPDPPPAAPPRPGPAIVVVDASGTTIATWPLECSEPPTLDDVDRLARVRLAAQRFGLQVALRDAPDALLGLLALVGLAGLFPAA
jgi:hypothetical protein